MTFLLHKLNDDLDMKCHLIFELKSGAYLRQTIVSFCESNASCD